MYLHTFILCVGMYLGKCSRCVYVVCGGGGRDVCTEAGGESWVFCSIALSYSLEGRSSLNLELGLQSLGPSEPSASVHHSPGVTDACA